MPECNDATGPVACVLYDGQCPVCRRWVARVGPLLHRHGFALDTLQRRNAPLTEMRCVFANGRVFDGAEAILAIAWVIPWSRPMAWFGSLPGVRHGLGNLYQWFATRRHCVGEVCRTPGDGLQGQCNAKRRQARRHRATTFFEIP